MPPPLPNCRNSRCCRSCIWSRCMPPDSSARANSVFGRLLVERRISFRRPTPFPKSAKYLTGRWDSRKKIGSDTVLLPVECPLGSWCQIAFAGKAWEPSSAFRADPHSPPARWTNSLPAAGWSDSTVELEPAEHSGPTLGVLHR